MKRITCLLLVLVMLCLAACSAQPEPQSTTVPTQETTTEPAPTEDPEDALPDHHFSKMEYTRPDPEAVLTAQSELMALLPTADWTQLDEAVSAYLDIHHAFEDMFVLTRIHYNLDLSDSYWEEEYQYCSQELTRVQTGYEKLLYALADTEYVRQLEESYLGIGALSAYTGTSFLTEEMEALILEETRMMDEYYTLSAQLAPSATDVFEQIEALLVEMVKLRRKIAATAGYDSFPEYAYKYTNGGRDYGPAEARAYLDQVRTEIAPLFAEIGTYAPPIKQPESGTAFEYLKALTQKAGGTLQETFTFMEEGKLYDAGMGPNKMWAGFCAYLNSRNAPYIFIHPTAGGSVPVALTHEFGHFCQMRAGKGLRLNVDTTEVFSQALEYLGMIYGDGTQNQYQRYSLLQVYVTSAAQADFELRLYALPEEELTPENINALFVQVGKDWGIATAGGFNRSGLVATLHFYLSPMYMLSYCVSGDTALQMYQLELQTPGAGLSCFEKALTTNQTKLLGFTEEMGLTSPFAPGHVQQIREIWNTLLLK